MTLDFFQERSDSDSDFFSEEFFEEISDPQCWIFKETFFMDLLANFLYKDRLTDDSGFFMEHLFMGLWTNSGFLNFFNDHLTNDTCPMIFDEFLLKDILDILLRTDFARNAF